MYLGVARSRIDRERERVHGNFCFNLESTRNMLSTMLSSAPITKRVPIVTMRAAAWKPGEVAPSYLDGSLPADAGCDPLCLAALATPVGVKETTGATGSFLDRIVPFPWSIEQRRAIMEQRSPEERKITLEWMRESEIKHARLAMLAVIGWPLAEIMNPFNALAYTGGRAPALLNGGLDAFTPFLLLVAGATAYLELQTIDDVNQTWLNKPTKKYVPGDIGFDPLDLAAKAPDSLDQAANEVYNGRLAMLAITGAFETLPARHAAAQKAYQWRALRYSCRLCHPGVCVGEACS